MCRKYELEIAKLVRKNVLESIPIFYDLIECDQYLRIEDKTVYFPDLALISKYTLRKICWVELKSTSSLIEEGKDFEWIQGKRREINWDLWNELEELAQSKLWYDGLNVDKHENYNIVAQVSQLPVFLIVKKGSKLYWSRIDVFEPDLIEVHWIRTNRGRINPIPVSERLDIFFAVIKKLIETDRGHNSLNLIEVTDRLKKKK